MTALRVLLVEDVPSDAKLQLVTLAQGGYEVDPLRVETAAALRDALAARWDIVLCDWSLHGFDAMAALAIVQGMCPDLPFILVSGTIGEELAVEAVRAGATDYVLKNRLERLVPAVRRALREAHERAARVRAEEQMQREQARFRAMIEHGGDGILVLGTDGLVKYASPAMAVMSGYPLEELVGKTFLKFVHPGDRADAATRLVGLIASQGDPIRFRRRLVRADGGVRHVEVVASNHLRDPAVQGLLANLRDVTDTETTRSELAQAQSRFEVLRDAGLIGITIEDLEGPILEANDTFLAMLGYTREELAAGALDWRERTPPEWADRSTEIDPTLAREVRARVREKEYFRKDGTRVAVLAGGAALGNGRALGVYVDLTESKRTQAALRETERQLRHSQKMEAVGRLAGGVAHDFNNLLSVILTYADLMCVDLPEGDRLRADVEEIAKAGKRAAALTHQLLLFSRQQMVAPQTLSPNALITDLSSMLRRLVGEDVELSTDLRAEGMVHIDPGGLEQVILNLAVNARDAMPRGGRLGIRTEDDDEPFVVLSISDDGEGMDEATQLRVFEPFFTTKPIGKGTGLGLSTVFGIVQQAGGSVSIDSAVGKGATFHVRLPRVTGPASSAHAHGPRSDRGTETILLVEDDIAVRKSVRRILVEAGYRVIDPPTPHDALALVERGREHIDLLLSDVVMPLLSGPQLAEAVRALQPRTAVLLMSGYTDDEVLRHGVLEGSVPLLQKPFTPPSVRRLVREVLDARERSEEKA